MTIESTYFKRISPKSQPPCYDSKSRKSSEVDNGSTTPSRNEYTLNTRRQMGGKNETFSGSKEDDQPTGMTQSSRRTSQSRPGALFGTILTRVSRCPNPKYRPLHHCIPHAPRIKRLSILSITFNHRDHSPAYDTYSKHRTRLHVFVIRVQELIDLRHATITEATNRKARKGGQRNRGARGIGGGRQPERYQSNPKSTKGAAPCSLLPMISGTQRHSSQEHT